MADREAGERIKDLRDSANDAAKNLRVVYTGFLLVSVYVAILIGSTTDEELLRGSDVKLPLLNIGIPIVGVYIVVPALYIILHFNLLVQF